MLERLSRHFKLGVRSLFVLSVLVGALVVFARIVDEHYPIDEWLFWRFAAYWVCSAAWLVGVLGVGQLTVTRLFRLELPLHETTVIAVAVGLFEFELAMLGVGALHGFQPATFGLVPLVFLAGGYRGAQSLFARFRALFERRRPTLGALELAAVAFGLLVFALIYFAMLTPENVQFDSRWKHMSLAEDWVAYGGLRRQAEGWLFAARPHMTSLLFSWAFLLPGARLFDKMLLCAHLELVIFMVTTLVGIPALVRRLVPGVDPRVVWVARFLFPGVLLYDSSLSAGIDHIGALFMIPAALCLTRAWPRLDPRPTLLLALMLAAGLVVKETIALMLLPVPVATVIARALFLLVQGLRGKVQPGLLRNAWRSPLLAAAVAVLATAPLWLENLIWFGDPLYPTLHAFFSPHPWSANAAYRFRWGYEQAQMWAPDRDLEGVAQTLRALVTFSFEPHDWKRFHKSVPVFGSLFTLLCAVLPFCKGTKRIWALVGWIYVAIFAWFSVHHQDRYLQGLMPLMASATAATMALVWRQHGTVVRGALSALVGLQIIWGGDVAFFQTHAMARSPLKKSIDLLSAGFEHRYGSRFNIQTSYQNIGKRLPPGARVLMHETNINLGTGHTTVLDNPGWQYAIEYGMQKSPAELHALLSSLGVTHLHARIDKSKGTDSLAGDIRFYDYLRRYAQNPERLSSGLLAELGDAPEGPFDDSVAILSCGHDYQPGLYKVLDLATPPFGPRMDELPEPRTPATLPDDTPRLVREAEFVVVNPRCFDGGVPGLRSDHSLLIRRNGSKAMSSYEILGPGLARAAGTGANRRGSRTGRRRSGRRARRGRDDGVTRRGARLASGQDGRLVSEAERARTTPQTSTSATSEAAREMTTAPSAPAAPTDGVSPASSTASRTPSPAGAASTTKPATDAIT